MTKSCPVCGAAASGKFCSQCGSPLELERVCTDCGNVIPPGGRFCNNCGKPAPEEAAASAPAGARGAPRAGPSARASSVPRPPAASAAAQPDGGKLPWIIGGVAVALVLAVVLIPRLRSEPETALQAPTAGTTGNPPDLASMTPEDAALRLFSRVMTAASAGDSAQAREFAPMAIAAYGMIPELTLDHRYDLAMINFVTGDAAAAAAQADTILATAPTHLFGLAAAAEAAARLGDAEKARQYYQSYVDNYDSEVANNAVAYQDHPNLPAAIRMAALAYLDASGQ